MARPEICKGFVIPRLVLLSANDKGGSVTLLCAELVPEVRRRQTFIIRQL